MKLLFEQTQNPNAYTLLYHKIRWTAMFIDHQIVESWKTHTNKQTNKHTKRRKYCLVTNKTVILNLILFALWQRTITLLLNIRQCCAFAGGIAIRSLKRPRKRNWLSSTGRRNLLDNIERLVQALVHLTLRLTTSPLKSKALPPPFTKQGCNDLNIITESQNSGRK